VPSLFSQPIALLLALLAAGAMGFAIQQGGTCMVAAVDQLIARGKVDKLAALAECSLWTSALGLLAGAAGLTFAASPGYPVGPQTLAGGFLLGAGAWLNGACVFGSIARIGGRDWHFLLTPIGFLVGCVIHAGLVGAYPVVHAAPGAGIPTSLLAVLVIGSLGMSLLGWRRAGPLAALWNYRHATIAIGLAFVVLAVIAGPWTYTEALGGLAHGKMVRGGTTALLFAALLGGALTGGRGGTSTKLNLRRALSCATGGLLMGLGSSLIPGGNDNLILVGLPSLQAHAVAAIAMMVLAIALGLLGSMAAQKFSKRKAGLSC
jgi:toxin CptA